MSEVVGGQCKQRFSGGKIQKTEVVFLDNYTVDKKIMILTNRTGKGNQKDKVKDINNRVSLLLSIFLRMHCKKMSLSAGSVMSIVTHTLNRETEPLKASY